MTAAIREARDSGMIGRRSGPAPHEAAIGGAPVSSQLSAKPGDLTDALDAQERSRGELSREHARVMSL